MKKILFLAVATAVALSSCSKNEVMTTALDNQIIGFSNYVGTSTKGSNVNAASLNNSGQTMGVFAYLHADNENSKTGYPNFMNNEVITATATYGTWSYTNLKYWPTGSDEIDFYAYAPYSSAQTTTSTVYPVVSFTQDNTLTSMVDYVYATADDQTSTSGTTAGCVNFEFKHALSRISFSAKAAADYRAGDTTTKTKGTYIYIKKIVASVQTSDAVKSSFNLTFSNDSGSKATTTATTTTTAYHNSASWEIFSKKAETSGSVVGVELTYDASNVPVATNFTTLSNDDGSTVLLDASEASGTVTTAGANKYIFLVPQTIVGGKTGSDVALNDIKVEVTYYTESYTAANTCATSSDITTEAYLPATTFLQGTAYNFPLSVSLNSISFGTVAVTSWGTEQ